MKILKVHIRNFKGIQDVDIDFMGTSGPRPLTALLGDNGSGKTTVLQAIALVLSMATGKTKSPSDFRWSGFLADRVSSRGETTVKIDVSLDRLDISYTQELYRNLFGPTSQITPSMKPPLGHRGITLTYSNGRLHSSTGTINSSPLGISEFQGRWLLQEASETNAIIDDKFYALGDIFWFDQNRNISTVSGGGSWAGGVERLRDKLIHWWVYHTSPKKPGYKDSIKELEEYYSKLFPGAEFIGGRPSYSRINHATPLVTDLYFLLKREGCEYDITEMSSGEQAIFPLLYEFVLHNITKSKSIVLIDELEMHLHPPQQQDLLRALPIIGPDCQYIITTHSDYLSGVIPKEYQVYLEKGRNL